MRPSSDHDGSCVCAVCRRPLNHHVFTVDDKVTDEGWTHTYPTDHDPVPLFGLAVADQVSVCDFCGATGPMWTFPAETFDTPTEIVDGMSVHGVSVEDWGACDQCKDAIEKFADDAKGLANEVWPRWVTQSPQVLNMEPIEQLVIRKKLIVLWELFLTHRSGEPYRGTPS